jgi:hypothetical protein
VGFNHIVIDLETAGTATDSALLTIGAVRVDLEKGELGETFYRLVNLKSSQVSGGKIYAETFMWWLQQSEVARMAICGDDSTLIDVALMEFSIFVREGDSLSGIWGNGSDFDNVLLAEAYPRCRRMAPWTYKQNRCYRTLAAMCPELQRETFRLDGTHHNALDDACTQARHLCAIWKVLKK